MKPRILMQQEDGSPGSGAVPPPAPAPAEAPAQGAAPPAVDVKAIAAEVRDSLFAELRRSGLLGKQKSETTQPRETKNETNNADDPSSLLALRDAFDDATSEMKLTKGQRQLLREAVMSRRPGDVDTFVSDFASRAGWGVAQPQAAAPAAPTPAAHAATTAAPAAPRSAVPISGGGGSPPAPTVPLEERDILSLSESDKLHLIKTKGPVWYSKTLAEQNKNKLVRIR